MKTLQLRQVGPTAVEMAGGTGEDAWAIRVNVPGEGAKGSGPKPTELLALALAACKAMTALQYAQRKGHELQGLAIDVDYEMAENPRRIARITTRFSGMKTQLDAETLERVTAAMKACTISRTLEAGINLETFVE